MREISTKAKLTQLKQKEVLGHLEHSNIMRCSDGIHCRILNNLNVKLLALSKIYIICQSNQDRKVANMVSQLNRITASTQNRKVLPFLRTIPYETVRSEVSSKFDYMIYVL